MFSFPWVGLFSEAAPSGLEVEIQEWGKRKCRNAITVAMQLVRYRR